MYLHSMITFLKQAFDKILTMMESFFPEDFSQDIMENKVENKFQIGLQL